MHFTSTTSLTGTRAITFTTGTTGNIDILLLTILSLLLAQYIYKWTIAEDESAVDFTVATPEWLRDGWLEKAEVLEVPEIKIPGSTAIQCYCPANGKLLGRINPHTAEGIDRAIKKAEEAQKEWAKTTWPQRRKVLRSLLKYILANQELIAQAACLDSGKTRVDASFGEILVTAEKLAWSIKHGEASLKTETRPTNLLMCYKRNEVRYEPLGVVAALVSWNYPFHNLFNPLISSLITGNALILKSSEQTAFSAQYFISIARACLSACGHSPNLIQLIVCWPSVAPHLTSHPRLSHITFIGSRPVAHHVARSASKALTPLTVELGGKDAAIILDDVADLKGVASILMRGTFQSAGQNCVGIERIIALPSVYPKLVDMLTPRIRSLRQGDAAQSEESVDIGAAISPAGFDELESLIADAVSRGARLLAGGRRWTNPAAPKGHYFSPTLLVDVTRDMPIAQNELFGPVCVIMRAETVSDAIAITNSTEYGLGCSVFGTNKRDLERVAREVSVGMVAVNDFAAYYVCGLPFGGVRGSGYGRFGGAEGLRALCNTKSVCLDRFSWGGYGLSTKIPGRLDYVVQKKVEEISQKGLKGDDMAKEKAWQFAKGIVEVGYGMSLRQRVVGVVSLVKNG